MPIFSDLWPSLAQHIANTNQQSAHNMCGNEVMSNMSRYPSTPVAEFSRTAPEIESHDGKIAAIVNSRGTNPGMVKIIKHASQAIVSMILDCTNYAIKLPWRLPRMAYYGKDENGKRVDKMDFAFGSLFACLICGPVLALAGGIALESTTAFALLLLWLSGGGAWYALRWTLDKSRQAFVEAFLPRYEKFAAADKD